MLFPGWQVPSVVLTLPSVPVASSSCRSSQTAVATVPLSWLLVSACSASFMMTLGNISKVVLTSRLRRGGTGAEADHWGGREEPGGTLEACWTWICSSLQPRTHE